MFRPFGLVVVALLALGLARPAAAYTPEDGVWWNPNEPGYGLLIETQDNYMAVFAYTYDAAGNAQWYTATGFLDGNALFESELNAFTDGTCLGCLPTRPASDPYIAYPGIGGPITIVFDPDDQTRATLTWGGRTVPIERFQFYLHRPEDGSAPIQVTKMLGEWNSVFDFTYEPSNESGVQYYGDVMVIDDFYFSSAQQRWYFEGCRPSDMFTGSCSATPSHDLAGYYDAEVDRQVIVVTDSRDSHGDPVNCLLYDVTVRTDDFIGGSDYDFAAGNDGGVTVYPCGAPNPFAYSFYPVRGFRTASRTFVQEGTGPSKRGQLAAPAAARMPLPQAALRADSATGDPKALARRIAGVRALEAMLH